MRKGTRDSLDSALPFQGISEFVLLIQISLLLLKVECKLLLHRRDEEQKGAKTRSLRSPPLTKRQLHLCLVYLEALSPTPSWTPSFTGSAIQAGTSVWRPAALSTIKLATRNNSPSQKPESSWDTMLPATQGTLYRSWHG